MKWLMSCIIMITNIHVSITKNFCQQGFNRLSNVSEIQKVSLVQKQPRVSLPKWNTNHLQGEGKIVLILFVYVMFLILIRNKYDYIYLYVR